MELKTRSQGAYAQVNGARLYYEERGAGFPLVFIPGGSVDASHYATVADRLTDEFRTVTFDRRGNGRSPRPPGWYATSIAEQADDVAGLIEALGLAPCAVWAGSLGGVILLELLMRRPGLVSVAIVHEPPLFGVLDDGEQLAAGLLRFAARAIRENAVRDAFQDHARQSVGDAFEHLPPDARERMFANAEVFFDLEIPALVDYRPTSRSQALRRIDIPLCVMADANNAGAPPVRAARWLAETLGAELRDLPGGHMPYATEPEATVAAIRAAIDLEGRNQHMSFQWGGLTDSPDRLAEQQPPANATRHRSSIEVIGYKKFDICSHEDGSVLVATVLTERFTGAIEGIGVADHIRLLHPDGTGISTGIERIEGTVNGRTGSFILTAYGRNDSATNVSGTWTVQPGSGTAELTGLRGRGSYTAASDSAGHWYAEDEFVCWFEDPGTVN